MSRFAVVRKAAENRTTMTGKFGQSLPTSGNVRSMNAFITSDEVRMILPFSAYPRNLIGFTQRDSSGVVLRRPPIAVGDRLKPGSLFCIEPSHPDRERSFRTIRECLFHNLLPSQFRGDL